MQVRQSRQLSQRRCLSEVLKSQPSGIRVFNEEETERAEARQQKEPATALEHEVPSRKQVVKEPISSVGGEESRDDQIRPFHFSLNLSQLQLLHGKLR